MSFKNNIREAAKGQDKRQVAENLVKNVRKNGIPKDFSFKATFEAFAEQDYNQDSPLYADVKASGGIHGCRTMEAVASTSFTFATSNIMLAAVQQGYQLADRITDQLVDTVPSTLKHETMMGFSAEDGMETVNEGEEYGSGGLTDRATQGPEPDKRGRMIQITEEALLFDQTGQILSRARQLGELAAYDRDYWNTLAIEDNSNFRSFYPMVAGTPTQTNLYRSSAAGTAWYNKTENAISNTLEDWSDLQAAYIAFAGFVDEKDRKITVRPTQLLVPTALYATAARILSAFSTAQTTNTNTETSSANAEFRAMFPGGLQLIEGRHLTSSTNWFLGNFQRQFKEQEIMPIQVMPMQPKPNSDVVAAFGARYKSRTHAVDDKFVVRGGS